MVWLHSFFLACALGLLTWSGMSLAVEEDSKTAQKLVVVPNLYDRLDIFAETLTVIEDHYLEKAPRNQLIYGAIEGMLYTLDPNSQFFDPAAFEELRTATEGHYSGIGVEITYRDDAYLIVSAISNGPAAKMGIRTGDKILAIDDASTDDMTFAQVMKAMKGAEGSVLKLLLGRSNEQPKTYSIKRERIALNPVVVNVRGEYAILKVEAFQEDTAAEAIAALRTLPANTKGLVIDLRDNPGGLLDQAAKFCNAFLRKGSIVAVKGRGGKLLEEHKADPALAFVDMPVIVLANGGTASAGEIVVGALRDHKRARFLGEKTFGKGTVQTFVELRDHSGIKLTIAKYYTPSGADIDHAGIEPDHYCAPSAPHVDFCMDKALSMLLQ